MNKLSILVEQWVDKNGYGFEGGSGLDRLGKLFSALGYRSHGFAHGSIIEVFLSDNPGAIEAMVEWIGNQHSPEWVESLEDEM